MKLGSITSAFGRAGVDTVTGLEHISRIGGVDVLTEAITLAGPPHEGNPPLPKDDNAPHVIFDLGYSTPLNSS